LVTLERSEADAAVNCVTVNRYRQSYDRP
jgi:hypothetical protein